MNTQTSAAPSSIEGSRRPLAPLLLRNAAPAVASMLIMAGYQIVDGIMVGRRLGPDALAAVSLLSPVLALFSALAVMIGTGAAAKMALALGAGDDREAGGVLGLAVCLGACLGLVCAVGVGFLAAPILRALGSPDELNGLALAYLRVMAPFSAAYILNFILDLALRNDGKPILASALSVGGAFLNIALDYLFLYTLDFGIGGAALASGIAQSLVALSLLSYFILKARSGRAGLRLRRPRGGLATAAMIAANGSSELLSTLAIGAVAALMNRRLIGLAGPDGVAAFAVVQYLAMVASVAFSGLATGAQPVIGREFGAGNVARARRALGLVLGAATAAGLALAALMRAAAPVAIGLFVDDATAAAALALDAAKLYAYALPIMPLAVVGSAFFTSIESAGRSLIIAALNSFIAPALAVWLLPRILGLDGLWLTPLAAALASGALSGALLIAWSRSLDKTEELRGVKAQGADEERTSARTAASVA